jgi:hypothetical protein
MADSSHDPVSQDLPHWIVSSSPRVLRFIPITRTSLPCRPYTLDRHAEELVFAFLVVGGKGVLVEQHQFRVVRARFREVGKLHSDVAIRLDSRCMRSSSVIVL